MMTIKKRQKIRKAITIATFLLFPVVIFYFSPYIIIMGAIQGIIAASFIMFSIQFALSLFLGRASCGYVCHKIGVQVVPDAGVGNFHVFTLLQVEASVHLCRKWSVPC